MIIDLVKILKDYKIASCNVSMTGYYWPDVEFKNTKLNPLSIDVRKVKVKKIDTKKIFLKYIKSGMQEITLLPRLYHGIISRNTLDNIKNLSGSYFPGPSPDIANATVASLVLDQHYLVRLPVIISGTAYKSAAGMGVRGEHKGELSKVSQISSNVANEWNSHIPKLWLMNTIWPESCLKALEKANAQNYIEQFNFYPIYSRIWLKYKEYRPILKEFIITPVDCFLTVYEGFKDLLKWLEKRINKKVRVILKKEYVCKTKISLSEACEITNLNNKKHDNIDIIRKRLKK